MGVIADAFRARINDMQARHEQTLVEVEQLRKDAYHDITKIKDLLDQMIKDLDN